MRFVTGTMMLVLATGLAAQTAGPAGQKWVQGRLAYVKPDNTCNCIKDAFGLGLGVGTWFSSRLGAEADLLSLTLKSRQGSVSASELHVMASGLFNLVPDGPWYPYLRAGVGLARVDTPYSLTSGSADKFSYHAGVGVQRFFSSRGLASAEVRSVTIDTSARRVEYQGLLGIGLRWGAPAQAAAPAPAQAPVALPPAPPAPEPVAVAPAPQPAAAPAPQPAVAPAPGIAAQAPKPPARIVLDDATLHFANNQAALAPQGVAAIRQVARSLSGYGGSFTLVVTGYTSSAGGRALNLALSRKRAEAVARVLVAEGIAAERIQSAGAGPDRPIADNRTRAGQARNRRVKIEVKAQNVEVRHNEAEIMDAPPAPAKPSAAKP